MTWHLSYFTFHFIVCKPYQLNVLSNNFTLYSNLLEFLMLMNYAKLAWTSQNFDSASLNCCKNNTFKHFDLKIWTLDNMMLNFSGAYQFTN